MNVYVSEIARYLGAAGMAVDVFTRRSDAHSPDIDEFAPGARLIQVAGGPRAGIAKERMFEHAPQWADGVIAFAEASAVEYDLIHSHYWLSTVAGERIAARWQVPHLAMFHTLGQVKLRARASERETPERLEQEQRLVHAVDGIVAATEHERQLLRQLYRVPSETVDVVPLGVDLGQFAPRSQQEAREALGLHPDERIVLGVGRLQPLKGFDILIRSIAQLTGGEPVRLVIIGGDQRSAGEARRLEDVAREVGVETRVSMVGAVPHELIPRYYNASDVVAVPSFYESFGLVAVEAMASGVPVVASRVGGLASTIADGRTGYLIPWRCPEPFAEKIELLLRNEPLRTALGTAARDHMRQYSWVAVAQRLSEVYESAVSRHQARAMATGTLASSAP
jgi:D-inositol-3-phosphate glycosyltransferase